jgi:hypothetical protein
MDQPKPELSYRFDPGWSAEAFLLTEGEWWVRASGQMAGSGGASSSVTQVWNAPMWCSLGTSTPPWA